MRALAVVASILHLATLSMPSREPATTGRVGHEATVNASSTPLERALGADAATDVSAWRDVGAGDVIRERYELLEPLGHGGMGSVWVAHDSFLEIDVALKLLHPEVPAQFRTIAARRMLSEARATARLVHPNILRLFDVGDTAAGQPYTVMELLHGEDLSAHTHDGRNPVDPESAVELLLPIVGALEFAHGHGVVHRDVKPENIFFATGPSGEIEPKLIDFGIARHDRERPEELRLTQPGALLGSPLYMSPEQAAGEPADERSDLWSLCVVLYEALSGTPPFRGKNTLAIVRAVIDDDPLPLQVEGIDAVLAEIVMHGLRKDPADRWQDARSLGGALARWLSDRGHVQDIAGHPLEGWLEELPPRPTPQRSSSRPPSRKASGDLGSLRAIAHTSSTPETQHPRKRLLAVAAGLMLMGATGAAHWATARPSAGAMKALGALSQLTPVQPSAATTAAVPSAPSAESTDEAAPPAASSSKPRPRPRPLSARSKPVERPQPMPTPSSTARRSSETPGDTDIYEHDTPPPVETAKPKLLRPTYD